MIIVACNYAGIQLVCDQVSQYWGASGAPTLPRAARPDRARYHSLATCHVSLRFALVPLQVVPYRRTVSRDCDSFTTPTSPHHQPSPLQPQHLHSQAAQQPYALQGYPPSLGVAFQRKPSNLSHMESPELSGNVALATAAALPSSPTKTGPFTQGAAAAAAAAANAFAAGAGPGGSGAGQGGTFSRASSGYPGWNVRSPKATVLGSAAGPARWNSTNAPLTQVVAGARRGQRLRVER